MLSGYAISGGNKKIKMVEVKEENSETWERAEIYKKCSSKYAWCFWKVKLPYKLGNKYIVKAEDEFGNKQDKNIEDIWNIRGISNNAVHVN